MFDAHLQAFDIRGEQVVPGHHDIRDGGFQAGVIPEGVLLKGVLDIDERIVPAEVSVVGAQLGRGIAGPLFGQNVGVGIGIIQLVGRHVQAQVHAAFAAHGPGGVQNDRKGFVRGIQLRGQRSRILQAVGHPL